MPNLDSRVAAVLDRADPDSDGDEDALIDALEKDEGLDGLREQRIQQLHEEYARAKQLVNQDHGTYQEIKDEKVLLDITTSTKLCVVHFFRMDFNRCRIMDSHLETLAPMHLDTRFLRVDVSNAPFLVARLKVIVLPCVLAFVDGIGVDRIVGFEGVGRGTDSFKTKQLEARLVDAGVLVRAKVGGTITSRPREAKQQRLNEDDYDEWE